MNLVIPAHVPSELVVEFDYTDPPGVEEDLHLAWSRLHQGPDIFWTPHNGGHWVVTRGDDVDVMQRNHELFSYSGHVFPKMDLPFRLIPTSLDPPEHTQFRNLIQPFFSPKSLQGLDDEVRRTCAELIDAFRTCGHCDFMEEFAHHLPLLVFLKFVELPIEDRAELQGYAEAATRGQHEERVAAGMALIAYLEKWIAERRARPGNDLISGIVNARINGAPITDADLRGTLLVVLFGGLDTVASMLGFFAKFLAEHPAHRRQLIEDPRLIPAAVEELMRRHGIAVNGRELTRDIEYKGIQFKKGDFVCVANMMYGLDDRKFADPLTVDFHRPGLVHAAFGAGEHRCPGSYLARTELKIFIEEWLKRIPEFGIAPGDRAVARSGAICGLTRLPLAWPA